MKKEKQTTPKPAVSIERDPFLHFLKEEGIEEIYPPQIRRSVAQFLNVKEAAATPGSPQTATGTKTSGTTTPREELIKVREKALACTLCQELASTRKSVVFGAGNVNAELMFIGEAPGFDEDEQGLPFVGKAGQLLTKIIESIGLTRKQVFIANTLKCRPPQNRAPKPEEILNCEPFLTRQIDLIRPKIICALGTFAAQTLLKTGDNISKLRGRFFDLRGIKVLCTFHPAYLLRNPDEKRKVWEDMKMIRRELDLNPSGGSSLAS